MRAHLLSLMVSTAAILLLWAMPPRRRRSRRRRGRRKSAARLWLVAMGVLLGITVVGGVLVSSDVKPFSTYAERYLLSGRSQAPRAYSATLDCTSNGRQYPHSGFNRHSHSRLRLRPIQTRRSATSNRSAQCLT